MYTAILLYFQYGGEEKGEDKRVDDELPERRKGMLAVEVYGVPMFANPMHDKTYNSLGTFLLVSHLTKTPPIYLSTIGEDHGEQRKNAIIWQRIKRHKKETSKMNE